MSTPPPTHKSYDDVEYFSMPVPEADPLLMSTIANLHDLETVDPTDCSYLEIGCGNGGNLFSLAGAYPGSRLTGFDPAEIPIQRGRDIAERTGITNVHLHHDASEIDLDASADYVVAHGVLTWVPDEARASVLELAGRAARPGALVNFSYRAYPHAYYEAAARDIGELAIEIEKERAAERGETLSWTDELKIARDRLQLVATVASKQPHHGPALAAMVRKWGVTPDWTLFHDDLSDPMQPFRLAEVVAMAAEQGLRYVGELIPQDLWQYRIPDEHCALIRKLAGPDAARRRQMADDFLGAAFHSSLFVKADEAPELEPEVRGRPIYVRQYQYGTEDGDRLSDAVSAPVAQVIREHHPEAVLATEIAEELGRDLDVVHRELLELHSRDLARLTTAPPRTPVPLSPKPKALPFAADQVRLGSEFLSSRYHVGVNYEYTARRAVLLVADGTRDRDQIVADLPAAAEAAGLSAGLDEVIATIDSVLENLELDGLFVVSDD
ncbi:MAG: class I SAM-dependent methyltransferase [Solirubrobacteraceae bacterium]|nr:class I SAM-dependent methyltransferase [Solirubrobacteraceae bacterium]